MLPFCSKNSVLFWLRHDCVRKYTRLSTIHIPGSLGTRLLFSVPAVVTSFQGLHHNDKSWSGDWDWGEVNKQHTNYIKSHIHSHTSVLVFQLWWNSCVIDLETVSCGKANSLPPVFHPFGLHLHDHLNYMQPYTGSWLHVAQTHTCTHTHAHTCFIHTYVTHMRTYMLYSHMCNTHVHTHALRTHM